MKIVGVVGLALLIGSAQVQARPHIHGCAFGDIPLRGKVKIVDSFPDIKVKMVSSFSDIKVKIVTSFPNNCGKWQFVESFPDFTIKFVDSFPDLKVKFVDSFPGMRR